MILWTIECFAFLLIQFGVIERLQGRPSLLYNMYVYYETEIARFFLSFFQLQTATTTEKRKEKGSANQSA